MSVYLSGSYQDLATQAQQHLRNNEYDKAQEIYERLYNRLGKMKTELINRRPNLKVLQLNVIKILGDLAGLRGEYDRAIAYYQEGLDIDPLETLEYQRAIAQMKIDKGDVEDGLDELRALAVMNAGQPDPWIWLGLELAAHGDQTEAEVNLKRAAEMEDADPLRRSDAYTYLYDLFRDQDRSEEAEAAWKKAWEVSKSNMDDPSPLYQMFWEVGNLEKAQTWLSKEKNPLRSGFYRGLFAQAEDNERRAKQFWKKTADLSPLEYDSGHEAWAEAALRLNYPPQRVAFALREVTRRGQLNMRGAILLAIAEVRAGQLDAAEVALEAAVDINRRARPRKDFLSKVHWDLFAELVDNEEARERFKSYFELEKPQEKEQRQMNKAQLIQAVREEQANLDELLTSLDETQMVQPEVYGDLTIKDVLAHLTAWERMEIGWLQASLRGEIVTRFAPGYILEGNNSQEVIDQLNEHVYQENKDKPLREVLDDFQAVHLQIIETIETMSEEDLTDLDRFDWWAGEPIWTSIAGNTYRHFQEHRELIETWLNSNP